MPIRVSAVIPNYNGVGLLKRNLNAVVSCLRPGDELIIVDDASSDNSLEWLKNFETKLKLVKKISFQVIVNSQNLRFAATVNKGVKAASGDVILLLNNDVRPHVNILKYLLPYFSDKSSNVFAVGCLEVEQDSAGKVVLGGKNHLWFKRGLFMHSRARSFASGSTAWVSGGSGSFDKKKWLQLGGFDQLFYPAYWEDIDLSFRARQRCWQVLFEEKAVVKHVHESTHASVFGSKQISTMSWNNAIKFTWKNSDWWQKVQYLWWRPYWWIKYKVSAA